MDGEHTYEINLKKDDLFICLSSDDVYFISKQMDKWFRILLDDSYVPVSLPKPVIAPPPTPESLPAPPVEAPVAQAQPQPAPQPVPAAPVPPPVAAPAPEPAPVVAEAAPPPAAVEVPPVAPPPPAPEPVAVAPHEPAAAVMPAPVASMPEAVAALETPVAPPPPTSEPVATLPPPAPAPVAPEPVVEPVVAAPAATLAVTEAPPAATPLDPAVSDDFEAVMDSLMKDFEEEEAPAHGATVAASNGNGRVEEAALPDLSTIASLAELCDQARAASSEDYLLLSAYYLTDFDSLPKFSLKRINSLLVKSGLTPVNHSVLETTMTRGYLSMVPDLTGMADVSEYVMTAEGREAAVRLL